MQILLGIIGGVLVLGILWFIITRNSFVYKKNEVDRVFATIDVLLKKRFDLIPNLIATVKQYMTHESETLTKIAQLRGGVNRDQMNSDQKVALDNNLTRAIGGIMVAVENYPDLKANQNFLQLQSSMNEIEEQISAARRAYNATVTELNNAIEMFPSNIVAGMLSLTRAELFEISEEQRQNPNASALFGN